MVEGGAEKASDMSRQKGGDEAFSPIIVKNLTPAIEVSQTQNIAALITTSLTHDLFP